MPSILDVLERIHEPKILVFGDLILDRYVEGGADRVSPEAPVLVFRSAFSSFRLGGAGNVASNVVKAGGQAAVLGLVGEDAPAEHLETLLREEGICIDAILRDPDRPTTVKTRFVSKTHQVLRVDEESVRPPSEASKSEILAYLKSELATFDAVILSDYGKGALTRELIAALVELAAASKIPVLADPKGRDFSKYRGVTLITPNKLEAELASGTPIATEKELESVAEKLVSVGELASIVITLGKDGIYYRNRKGERDILPTEARSVFDVTGAGDTVVAWLGIALGSGIELRNAVRLANLAAGITVGRFGTAAVERDELRSVLGVAANGKILDERALTQVLVQLRDAGKKIVFTNGCFDLLHPGHIDYLSQARSYGDALIVGINEDASIRKAKGEERPIQPIGDRLEMLAALEAVDYVVPFGEDTPKELIERVCPSVLVKGEDWRDKGVVGRDFVEAHGGQVVLIPLKSGYSSTALIDRIRSLGASKSGS